MVHDCTDSLALLSHVNSSLEQNRRDNIAYCWDNQYHALRKNGPCESEFLFGDDLPKRIMNITTNKLFTMPSKPYTSFKTSKNLHIMGTKGITLVNTRNLTTTCTATAAKNKREIKYGKSTSI